MIEINLKTNVREFERGLSNFAWKQLPFATAIALTALTESAAADEVANMDQVIDRPRPFTIQAIRVRRATKANQEAALWMADITARYLEPYEFGGRNVLNRGMQSILKPVAAMTDLDQYGNLPRNFLRQIKGRSDVFIGTVATKAGPVYGVWQRYSAEGTTIKHTRITKNGRVVVRKVAAVVSPVEGRNLKLLVRFEDPHPIRQNLDWFGVAQRAVAANFKREMGRALARAIATAK